MDRKTLAQEIGGRLYDARTARRGDRRGMSQSELARESSVVQQRISQIESGEFDAGALEQIAVLARTLGVSPAWLAFGEGEARPASDEERPEPGAPAFYRRPYAELPTDHPAKQKKRRSG